MTVSYVKQASTLNRCLFFVLKYNRGGDTVAGRPLFLHVTSIYPYEKKNLLMLGFLARVNKKEFKLSGEVDNVEWFPIEEAPGKLREGGIAWQLVKEINERKAELL